MERARNLVFASALLLGSTLLTRTGNAQSAQAGAQANGQTNVSEKSQAGSASLAAGTAVNAELDKSLDSKKAKVGDPVSARTTEAVKEDGKVVLPKGSKLIGHVTRASARGKGDSDSTLVIQFDRAELKGGSAMPVQLNVQAMAAAPGVAPIGGDDLQGMGSTGASAPMGGTSRGGAGAPVGGAVSGAASTAARTTANTAGTVNSTTNAAGGVVGAAGATTQGSESGLNSSGRLTAKSRGVFGLNGLSLNTDAANATQGSVIASSGKSVQLDSGTRLLLVTPANTSASAQP